jgi:hypothetical protein
VERIASIIRVIKIGEIGTKSAVTSNQSTLLRVLATTNVVPSSPILATLMLEAKPSSETSVLSKAARRNISEDGIQVSERLQWRRVKCTEHKCYKKTVSCLGTMRYNGLNSRTTFLQTILTFRIAEFLDLSGRPEF